MVKGRLKNSNKTGILNKYFFEIKLLEATKILTGHNVKVLVSLTVRLHFELQLGNFSPFIFIVYFLLTFNWVGMRALPLGSRTRLVTGCSVSKWPKVGALLFIVLCLKAKCSRNLVFKNNLFYFS